MLSCMRPFWLIVYRLKEGKIRLSSSGKVSKPLQEDVIGPFVHSVMPRLLLHAGPAKTARTLVVLGSGTELSAEQQ